jgi:hypothetical protein
MGYIPDLEVSSSAKKKKANGANKKTKGRSLQNYHRVLDAVLFSLVECQESGGFDAYVRMGDYVRYLKVIPVVCPLLPVWWKELQGKSPSTVFNADEGLG